MFAVTRTVELTDSIMRRNTESQKTTSIETDYTYLGHGHDATICIRLQEFNNPLQEFYRYRQDPTANSNPHAVCASSDVWNTGNVTESPE